MKTNNIEISVKFNSKNTTNISLIRNKINVIIKQNQQKISRLFNFIAGITRHSDVSVSFNEDIKVVNINRDNLYFPFLNVYENINLINEEKEKVFNVINYVGLMGYEYHYSNKNSTTFNLRIALGRAVLMNADLVIIDDFENIQDEKIKNSIYSLLQKISLERTILVTSCLSPDIIKLSDSILIEDGDNFLIKPAKV